MSAKKAMTSGVGTYRGVLYALLVSNGISLLLFLFRVADGRTFRYWYLFWNLLLAWLPLLFAGWLSRRLTTTRWLSPGNIVLTLLWLGFLPNSFYLISDLIHLQNTGEVGLLYDAVLFMSFIFNGCIAGFMSLYLVHRELIKRLRRDTAHSLAAAVIVICSFAIYLGRALRWNTWDVLINPAGLLFDVSDRFVNPSSHPQTFVTTASFSLLLGGAYLVVWQLVQALRNE